MDGKIQFIIFAVVLLVGWMAWSFRGANIFNYLKTKDGLGILKGIVLVLLIAGVILFVSGCNGTYFNDAHIFAGLDYANEDNGTCERKGVDDRTTSNVGIKANIYQSKDKTFRANGKYTHHSCAFNIDDHAYDAIGLEAEYKIW